MDVPFDLPKNIVRIIQCFFFIVGRISNQNRAKVSQFLIFDTFSVIHNLAHDLLIQFYE